MTKRIPTGGWLLLLAAGLALGAGPEGKAPDAKAMKRATREYQRGHKALEAHRLDQARSYFERALEIAPGLPQAELGLGHVSMMERDFDAALAHYRKAKAGYAPYGEATLQLEARRYAQAREQIQRLRDAISQLQSASGTGRGPRDANLRISQLLNSIQQLEAVEPPDASRSAEPPAELDFYIGNAQFQLGNLEEAITSWEECARRNPDFPLVYNNLALGYWKSGRLDDALKSLARAEELGFPVNPHFKSDLEAAARSAGESPE